MKATDPSNEELTRWVAEKYCIDEKTFPLSAWEPFGSIHFFDHLMMVVESERFPGVSTIGVYIWKSGFIIHFKGDEISGPLKDMGRKLLEALWEMEEGK